MTKKQIENKYNINVSIMDLNSIISAIPRNWKKQIYDDNNVTPYVIFKICYIKIIENKKRLKEVTTKDLYEEVASQK